MAFSDPFTSAVGTKLENDSAVVWVNNSTTPSTTYAKIASSGVAATIGAAITTPVVENAPDPTSQSQFAQWVYNAAASAGSITGVSLNMSGTGSAAQGYVASIQPTTVKIYKKVTGSTTATPVSATRTPTVGEVYYFRNNAGTLELYVGGPPGTGTLLLPFVDSTFTNGTPGIYAASSLQITGPFQSGALSSTNAATGATTSKLSAPAGAATMAVTGTSGVPTSKLSAPAGAAAVSNAATGAAISLLSIPAGQAQSQVVSTGSSQSEGGAAASQAQSRVAAAGTARSDSTSSTGALGVAGSAIAANAAALGQGSTAAGQAQSRVAATGSSQSEGGAAAGQAQSQVAATGSSQSDRSAAAGQAQSRVAATGSSQSEGGAAAGIGVTAIACVGAAMSGDTGTTGTAQILLTAAGAAQAQSVFGAALGNVAIACAGIAVSSSAIAAGFTAQITQVVSALTVTLNAIDWSVPAGYDFITISNSTGQFMWFSYLPNVVPEGDLESIVSSGQVLYAHPATVVPVSRVVGRLTIVGTAPPASIAVGLGVGDYTQFVPT